MKPFQGNISMRSGPPAGRRLLTDGLTLLGLGFSVLFLNSWNNLFVRTAIGLFWGAFFLISNWSSLSATLRRFREKNDIRRSSFRSSN